MQRFKICTKVFPELKGNIKRFKAFMQSELDAYIEDDKVLFAHNEGDSHWFTQQYFEGKRGKGIYQDWFKKKANS
jgi:hypothetical protein